MIYIFITSLLVLQALVVTESLTLNIRTTLFTPTDLARKRWNKKDVALLTARMYFQGLVPPMEVNQNAQYVRDLIHYIENCYASVNREAYDGETETILTIAVSDVLGGYLKMVALPVAKSAYYSGELPTPDALKLFKYYEDIKEQLGTDGQGWSKQLTNIVKTNNVRDPRSDSTFTQIKNACQQLYVKDNLTIPLPFIDWNTRTMFVPLTNQPIVDLRSPYFSSVLQQFHKIASACERSIYPEHRHYFQRNFENWVNEEVIPHLSDDDLYTAFKGILCLLDNTYLTSTAGKSKSGIQYLECLFHNMSKKTIIILSILIIELICCIPTLLFCVMKKKKKKSRCPFPTRLSAASVTSISKGESKNVANNDKTVLYELSSRSASFHNQSKFNSRVNFNDYSKILVNEANSDLSTASISRRSYSSITDANNTADEVPIKKYSKTSEKILCASQHQLRYKHTETDKIDTASNHTQVSDWPLSRTNSASTAINLNTCTLSKKNSYVIEENTGETVTLATALPQEKSSSKILRRTKRFRPRHRIESLSPESDNPFPSSSNVRLHEQRTGAVDELKLQLFDDKLSDIALMRFDSGKSVEFAAPGNETRAKNSEMSYKQSQSQKSFTSKRDSMRTITICGDRTQMVGNQGIEIRSSKTRNKISTNVLNQAITVNNEVTKNIKGILKAGEETTTTRPKKSRIPKKTSSPRPICQSPRPVRQEPESPRRKSRIPRLERALDDSAISSATPRDRRLNVTL